MVCLLFNKLHCSCLLLINRLVWQQHLVIYFQIKKTKQIKLTISQKYPIVKQLVEQLIEPLVDKLADKLVGKLADKLVGKLVIMYNLNIDLCNVYLKIGLLP